MQTLHINATTGFCIFRTYIFQLLDIPWSQVSFLPPLRLLPSFLRARRAQESYCSSICHLCVANSRPSAFRRSICAKENVAANLYERELGGLELTELTDTKLEDNLILYRGDRHRHKYSFALQVQGARQLDSVGAQACLLYGFVIIVRCGTMGRGWHRVSVKNTVMGT